MFYLSVGQTSKLDAIIAQHNSQGEARAKLETAILKD
jgi:hypothetical protein